MKTNSLNHPKEIARTFERKEYFLRSLKTDRANGDPGLLSRIDFYAAGRFSREYALWRIKRDLNLPGWQDEAKDWE